MVLERLLENLKTLDGRKLIAAEKADPNSFAFKQNYRQGLYELLLNQCRKRILLGRAAFGYPRGGSGLYAQQAYAANTLFGLRAADRGGDVYAADPSRQNCGCASSAVGRIKIYGAARLRTAAQRRANRRRGVCTAK